MKSRECPIRPSASRITPVLRSSATAEGGHHAPRSTLHAARFPRPSERGVALVITLLLLSVITFMAITFLVVSRSEHSSVATTTDSTIARLAADTARDRAIAEVLAPILNATNPYNYGLLVSTNYINLNGFGAGGLVANDLLNVNYDYTASGATLTLNQQLQNLQNLFFNPRPPVFIVTNALAVRSNEFRFYVDLNRNRMFDPTGFMPLTNALNQPIPGPFANLVGDPQWIGILQRPELFHSPTNLFVSRYAYAVVPMGQALDINTMHNDAKQENMNRAGDGFLRDQGIMTAEINTAGLLADLNTNYWPLTDYSYLTDPAHPNTGIAFDDAYALLRYRYAGNAASVAKLTSLFGPTKASAVFNPDYMDYYSGGPVMLGTWWPPIGLPAINQTRVANWAWSGSESPNRFYTTQDLFDQSKTRPPWLAKGFGFTDRLWMAGTNVDSYDRYTFSRLVSQLGTESDPEPQNKMNLNYRNVDLLTGKVVPGMQTNFYLWQPTNFFMNAAIRLMVDAGYTVGPGYSVRNYYSTSNLLVTNFVGGVWSTNLQIPIWPTNYYTPSLHRLLQLAANLYDATTNRLDGSYASALPYHLPTVFRPTFTTPAAGKAGARQAYITGYQELSDVDTFSTILNMRPVDLSEPNDWQYWQNTGFRSMVYNVPLVIGAKKGLPSFDEFTMDTQVQAVRKLIYHRQGTSTTAPLNEIDPAYYLAVTNVVGLQAWNSYAAQYKRPVSLYAWPDTSVGIINVENGVQVWTNRQPVGGTAVAGTPATSYRSIWPGYIAAFPQASFITPLGAPTTNFVVMPSNTVYSLKNQVFVPNGVIDRNQGSTNYHVPHLQLTLKARLRFALVDQTTSRLLDYVNLSDSQTVDITTNLVDGGCGPGFVDQYSRGGMWCTNRAGGLISDSVPTFGVRLQVDASSGLFGVPQSDWNSSLSDPIYGRDKDKGIARFLFQFNGLGAPQPGEAPFQTLNSFAAPFSPFRTLHLATCWQANDPLVHYTVGDLQNFTAFPKITYLDEAMPPLPPTGYGTVNRRYEPWGGNPTAGSTSNTKYDWRFKDPVAQLNGNSDTWDFPTNKFPNPGWLGRVHRGTPWQTVYLKSAGNSVTPPLTIYPLPPSGYPLWVTWSGNNTVVTNFGQLAMNMPQWISTTNIFGGVTNIFQVAYDSSFSLPTNDWRLLDLFSTSFYPNTTRGRLSINQTNLAAWSAVLSGVIALTNSGTSGQDANGNLIPTAMVIPPAGVYDPNPAVSNTWPAIVKIVNAINTVRANSNNAALPVFPNHVFHRLGDILAVPELTTASPFLSPNPEPNNALPNMPMNDAAMERLPQQILGLLKCDETPRVAIYAWGQTLKPAIHSRMTSGSFFGLVTNYQITAEVATRTIVRFDGVPPYQYGVGQTLTNLHPVIESFTVLPPD